MARHKENKKQTSFAQITKRFILLLVVGAIFYGGYYYYYTNQEILPPTDVTGHIEANPDEHIMEKPMRIAVHKHMLEHADGEGSPGIIINYNCDDFSCEKDFLVKLKTIVNKEEYKDFVYLAPFTGMTEKLVITKYNQQEILESLSEEKLKDFINN